MEYTDLVANAEVELTVTVDDNGIRRVVLPSPPAGTYSRIEKVKVSCNSGPPLPQRPMNAEKFKEWLLVLQTLGYHVTYSPPV
jgi:hypothetical protein